MPGILAATSALHAMVRAHLGHGPGANGVVFYPIGPLFIVWFGITLIVDVPLWRPEDRFQRRAAQRALRHSPRAQRKDGVSAAT